MSSMVFIFVPMVVFLVIVAPLWLILHYWSRAKESKGFSEQERQTLDDVAHQLDKLHGRIHSLEAILDDKHQGWRNDNH
ncbi:MAG: envelope stress response membrane protein PspB [Pseudomonadales bacterium]